MDQFFSIKVVENGEAALCGGVDIIDAVVVAQEPMTTKRWDALGKSVCSLDYISGMDKYSAGCSKGSVALFSLDDQENSLRWWQISDSAISTFCSDSSNSILCACEDGKIIRLENMQFNEKVPCADSVCLNDVARKSSSELVTAGSSTMLQLWDLRLSTTAPVARVRRCKSGDNVSTPAMHSVVRFEDQRYIAGDEFGEIYVWDVRKAEDLEQPNQMPVLCRHKQNVWDIKRSCLVSQVFSCSNDGVLLLWEVIQNSVRSLLSEPCVLQSCIHAIEPISNTTVLAATDEGIKKLTLKPPYS